jgi:molybdenum cofactor sulfurtransferase
MAALSRHNANLRSKFVAALLEMKYDESRDFAIIHDAHHAQRRHKWMNGCGGIVSFTLLRADGTCIGYSEVDTALRLSNIQVRTGALCNIGAAQRYLGLSDLDLRSHLELGHACWDGMDVIRGQPTGVVRVSFGMFTTESDIEKLIKVLREFFFIPNFATVTSSHTNIEKCIDSFAPKNAFAIKNIWIYPVKSCSGQSVCGPWPVGRSGLAYDR